MVTYIICIFRPSEVTESNDVPVLAIVGSVVGALVIGLIVILAVVITCLVCKAQRKKKNRFPSTPQSSQHGSVPGNNPVYEGTNIAVVCLMQLACECVS